MVIFGLWIKTVLMNRQSEGRLWDWWIDSVYVDYVRRIRGEIRAKSIQVDNINCPDEELAESDAREMGQKLVSICCQAEKQPAFEIAEVEDNEGMTDKHHQIIPNRFRVTLIMRKRESADAIIKVNFTSGRTMNMQLLGSR
jgi:hypothetical protein